MEFINEIISKTSLISTVYKHQSDISGNIVNDKQPLKISVKSVTLFTFHLDKSGNEINDEQPKNTELI